MVYLLDGFSYAHSNQNATGRLVLYWICYSMLLAIFLCTKTSKKGCGNHLALLLGQPMLLWGNSLLITLNILLTHTRLRFNSLCLCKPHEKHARIHRKTRADTHIALYETRTHTYMRHRPTKHAYTHKYT